MVRQHCAGAREEALGGHYTTTMNSTLNAYNRRMMPRTVHVYPLQGTWEVKKEGTSGEVYLTRREAIDAARKSIKRTSAGQFVVYDSDGQIKEHGVYKMTPIQDPPKKSTRAREIARAVGKLALERLKSDTTRERSSQE
jgi:hypothetical protein